MKAFCFRLVLVQLMWAAVQRGATLGARASTSESSFLRDCDGFVYVHDGNCDPANNNERCEYDGGDCCICTCVSSDLFTCGESSGYDCRDPEVSYQCVHESEQFLPLMSTASITTSTAATDAADATFPTTMYYYEPGEYSFCFDAGGFGLWIGDGWCDQFNAVEECEYDGGDCCICTCDANEYNCGVAGYYCQDPSVPETCVEESEAHVAPHYTTSTYTYNPYTHSSSPNYEEYPDCSGVAGFPSHIADGWCDPFNINEECGYDGGDCCICTCDEDAEFTCGSTGYDCQDPRVPQACVDESEAFVPPYFGATPYTPYYETENDDDYPACNDAGGVAIAISNAVCDPVNNIEMCGYDGGDCCICTCESEGNFTCGDINGFICQDPSVPQECVEASNSYVAP